MSTFSYLEGDLIRALHTAVISVGRHDKSSQDVLLQGIDQHFVSSLPSGVNDADRLLATLHELNRVQRLADGSVPLKSWLKNLLALVRNRSEAELFERCLDLVDRDPLDLRSALFEGPGRVPVLPVPHFVGRAAEMAALRAALSGDDGSVTCAVISGLGGIGKTALAHQFLATEAKALFCDGAVWLDGTSLPLEAARAAQRFGWTGAQPPSLKEAVQWLACELHERNVLIVIDDVDADPERTNPGSIPVVGGRSRTVITTRAIELHNDLAAVARPIVVGTWTAAESRVFLREIAPRLATSSDADIDALTSFVGNLPLAVGLLSKLLRRKGETPRALLGRLEREPLGTLDQSSKLVGRGVVATFQAAFHELRPSERKVLIALASCARATRARTVAHVASATEEVALAALAELEQCSLVEYADHSARPWGLHDVVRIFVRAQEGVDNADAGHLIFVEGHIARHENGTAWEAMEGEMQEVFTAVDRLLSRGEWTRACSIMESAQSHLVQRGRYAKLLDIYERLLPLLPEGEMSHAGVLGNMSNCYSAIGDTTSAFRCLEPLPAIHEKLGLVGAQANDFGNLGVFCAKIGDNVKAIAYHERALAIFEGLEDVVGQASQLGNLGNCYFEKGDLIKAIDLGKRALSLATSSTPRAAQARQLGNLGGYLLTGREPLEAIGYLQRALEINEQLGRHEEQARNLAYLGWCQEQMGDTKAAIDYVRGALILLRETGLSEDHAMIQTALSTLDRLGGSSQD